MTSYHRDFSRILREALQRENVTQAALAKQLRKDASTVSFWATGRQKPRLDDTPTLKRLAEFLGLSSHSELLKLLTEQPRSGKRRKRHPNDEFMEAARELAGRYDQPVKEGLLRQLDERGYEVDPAAFSEWYKEWLDEGKPAARQKSDDPKSETATDSVVEQKEDWLHTFRDAPKIRDAVRLICQTLNHVTYTTLEEALESVKADPGGSGFDVSKPRLKFLMDHICDLGLATWENDRFVQRWHISADYVLNSLFGFKSGVRRLDDLFDGGLLPAIKGGLVAILKGGYGRGKSTLALEIAASHAHQKQIVFYISTEENPELILERLSYIGYLTRVTRDDHIVVRYEDEDPEKSRQFIVATSNFIDCKAVKSLGERAGDENMGVLLIVSLPPPFAALMDEADEISKQLSDTKEMLGDRFTTLVVDSLDAVNEDNQRSVFERFFESQRRPRSFSLFVCNNDSTVKDFLADIVIKLGVWPRGERITERTIEIEKCRTQNHRRGTHALTIEAHEGVSVFPAIPSVLSTWKKKRPAPLARKALHWNIDERLNLDPLLRSCFLEGQTCLLYGEPGTRKLPLALSFLAAGIFEHQRENGDGEWRGAIITLIEDEQRLLKVAESYQQLAELMMEGEQFRSRHIWVLDEQPDLFFPERFFDRIRREVEKWQSKGLKRVVLNGLGTLIAQSPESSYESSLLPGILAIFRKERISTLLVETSPRVKGGSDLREVADVVLYTEVVKQKGEGVTLSVERSVTGNASDDVLIVEREPETGRLSLQTRVLPEE